MLNLINNAAKYAPDDKRIDVDIEQRARDVRVSVKDFGPGIPAEKIPDLFERYFSADNSGPQFPGLSLYISKEIIEKHGGQMHVDSVLNEGSTFWFTLPLKNQ
jgi:signal transduction histidine kinase